MSNLSEKALLIKRKQKEALERQAQEIRERDAIRKQKSLGINNISLNAGVHTSNNPQTLQDLFNSRYKPNLHQTTNSSGNSIKNNSENQRLKIYEEKRRKFLEKRRQQNQMQNQSQQPSHQPVQIQPVRIVQQPVPTTYEPMQPIIHQTQEMQINEPLSRLHQVQLQQQSMNHIYHPPKQELNNHTMNQPMHNLTHSQQLVDVAPTIQSSNPVQSVYNHPFHETTRRPHDKAIPAEPHGSEIDLKKIEKEKYRQELMKQIQEKEQQRNRNNNINNEYNQHNQYNNYQQYQSKQYESKQTEEDEQKSKAHEYAAQLEQQMKLKQLEKIAQREKQLLNDRKMMLQKGFLDGFGNNAIPRIRSVTPPAYHSPIKPIYRKGSQRKRSNVSPFIKNGSLSFIGYDVKEKQKEQQNKALQYKLELEKQIKEGQERKLKEQLREKENDFRLELKIQNDRKQLLNEYNNSIHNLNNNTNNNINTDIINNNNVNNGNRNNQHIFIDDEAKRKREREQKQELYQMELKKQREEIKRKKEIEKQKELQKEKELDEKIKKDLIEMQKQYKNEISKKNSPNKMEKNKNVKKLFSHNEHDQTPLISPKIYHDRSKPLSARLHSNNKSHISYHQHQQQSKPLQHHQTHRQHTKSPEFQQPNHFVNQSRPKTSHKMLEELKKLKEDLLENQKMIRMELQTHKNQIHEQIQNVSKETDEKLNSNKTFQFEIDKYHNKISEEIGNLRKEITKQQKQQQKQKLKQYQEIKSIKKKRKNKQKQKQKHLDDGNNYGKYTDYITYTESRPYTVNTNVSTLSRTSNTSNQSLSSFASNSSLKYNNNDLVDESRPNTSFTEFGIDEYLINESKKNNEYLQCLSLGDNKINNKNNKNNSRIHTPNIFKVDSLERDINLKFDNIQYKNSQNATAYGNIVEKSIKSKSDFVYDILADKQLIENNENKNKKHNDITDDDDDDETTQNEQNKDVLHELYTKNKKRLNYFRCTTPLDSTRSMKMGLQKIEDLLSKNNKLNRTIFELKTPSLSLSNVDNTMDESLCYNTNWN